MNMRMSLEKNNTKTLRKNKCKKTQKHVKKEK